MQRGLRAKLHFYEDYSGYSEKELDEKLKKLEIDVDSFSNYNGEMPVHEYKSLIIQNELFKLRDKEIETCYGLLKEKKYINQEERQKYEESINSLLDEKIEELNKLESVNKLKL
jgi:hypothetical protein